MRIGDGVKINRKERITEPKRQQRVKKLDMTKKQLRKTDRGQVLKALLEIEPLNNQQKAFAYFIITRRSPLCSSNSSVSWHQGWYWHLGQWMSWGSIHHGWDGKTGTVRGPVNLGPDETLGSSPSPTPNLSQEDPQRLREARSCTAGEMEVVTDFSWITKAWWPVLISSLYMVLKGSQNSSDNFCKSIKIWRFLSRFIV